MRVALCVVAGFLLAVLPAWAIGSVSLYPTRVYFVSQIGGAAPPSQDVAITSSSDPTSFTAASGASWLSVFPSQGTTPASIRITVNAAGLAAGTYSTTASINGAPAITATLAVVDTGQWTNLFQDVPADNLFFQHVMLLRTFNVTIGCNVNPPLFCTNQPVTRGQMAAFLTRALVGEAFSYTQTPYYSDVTAQDPFFGYIQKATDLGLLTACTPGQFCGNDPIKRSDMAVALVRALFSDSFSASQTAYFSDVAPSSPYFRYVQKLREIGTSNGCSATTYCPDDSVTRWQMAGFLARQFFGWQPVPVTDRPTAGPCNVFPPDNVWNTPVDKLPVHPHSAYFVATIGASSPGHADFGSGLWDGGPIGIPFVVVPGAQARVPISFYYPTESDPGPYPIPADAPIEGGAQSGGDRHVLIVDRAACKLYEVYDAHPNGDGSWNAGSGAVFDLNSNALRPAGWTSADAAGLPMLSGLVRYDEVAAGQILHAIRFTAPQTQNQFLWPARHQASVISCAEYPPMGLRFRLRANYDISGFSPECQVILRALKKYGMILADNGSAWFIGGVPDERWNNDHLHEFTRLAGSDFEAVDESGLQVDNNTARARQQ